MYIDKTYPFKPLTLTYDFTSLDSCFGCKSLQIHYFNIYTRYVNNLNRILEGYPSLQKYSLDELLFNASSIPLSIKDEVIFNAGGILNHQVFFDSISPVCYNLNQNVFKNAIDRSFGSVGNFFNQFKAAAKALIGSGYVMLVCNEQGLLSIITTKNQETSIPYNLYPLLAIDMWEHSYYLKYDTRKDEYIDAYLKCVNWPYINSEYISCLNY